MVRRVCVRRDPLLLLLLGVVLPVCNKQAAARLQAVMQGSMAQRATQQRRGARSQAAAVARHWEPNNDTGLAATQQQVLSLIRRQMRRRQVELILQEQGQQGQHSWGGILFRVCAPQWSAAAWRERSLAQAGMLQESASQRDAWLRVRKHCLTGPNGLAWASAAAV